MELHAILTNQASDQFAVVFVVLSLVFIIPSIFMFCCKIFPFDSIIYPARA